MEFKNIVGLGTRKEPVDPKKRKRKECVSVAMAGALSDTAVAPLRRLGILLQVQNSQNIIHGWQHMKRTDGFRELFKGNGAYIAQNMSFYVVHNAVHYPLARIIRLHWQQPGKENAEPPIMLTDGIQACALMIALAAAYPMNMVQGRLSVQTGKTAYQYRGICHALSTIAREEGPRALYKGCLPFTIGQVVYTGLNFTVYKYLSRISYRVLRRKLKAATGFDKNEFKLEDMKPEELEELRAYGKNLQYCHVLALAVSNTFAYPFNVIHRRMQMGGWKKASSIIACDGNNKAAIEFTGMCDAFKKTIRNDGFKALYRGSVPNLLLKVFPASIVASVIHNGLMKAGLEGAFGTNKKWVEWNEYKN